MAEKLESSAGKGAKPANKELVMQLIEEARSECFERATVKIEARGRGESTHEYIGTIARIDYSDEMIMVNEAQAIEGVPMREITSYEWL
jgi:hypothetical protein